MKSRMLLLFVLALALTLGLAACKRAAPKPALDSQPLDPQVVAAAAPAT